MTCAESQLCSCKCQILIGSCFVQVVKVKLDSFNPKSSCWYGSGRHAEILHAFIPIIKFFQHPQNEGMEHLTKIVGEYLTEPNSKVKAEDLVWTELDISISQK